MSIVKTFNSTNYTLPTSGEKQWGTQVTNFLGDLADNALDKNTAQTITGAKTFSNITVSGGSITGITDVAIADGGTGASTASAARTNLGATATGDALFTALDAATARTVIGVTATGDAIVTAASQSAARTAIGATATGDALITAASASSARTTIGVVIGTDVQAFDANTAKTNIFQSWNKSQYITTSTLIYGINVSWDLSTTQVASLTLTGNATLDNPTNMFDGMTAILRIKQDAIGSRTLLYGTAYKWPGGTAPTLSTAANAVDIITFTSDGTNMYGSLLADFK